MQQITHWVGGKAVPSSSGRVAPVWDPAAGTVRAEVGLADASEVDTAVATAVEAFPAWRLSTLTRRAELMFRFRDLLDAHRRDLASLVTREHGKTLGDALGEVARGIENVEYACGIPNLLRGAFSEQVSTGVDVYSVLQPLGVVAGITPFNFPVMVPLWMLANAVACGNCFVLKPSERDPSPSLLLAELLAQAGLPDGVFGVVQGDATAVDRLLEHPDVQAVSFVGSTPVARSIYATGTRHGKRVQALGGAKNHMVVLPDADVGLAADAAVSAGYGSAGERCMAVSVVVAVGEVADPLVAAIRSRLPALKVGPGDDPASDVGPLITPEHRDRVCGYIEAGAAEGAEVVVDGRRAEVPGNGFYLGPTLLDRVSTDMTVYRDEIFGPVLSVVRASSYDEALRIVNANPFGNGAALFTRSGAAARRFQVECSAGMLGINVGIPVPVASFSFGGWKSSLFGDTHMYGPDGIRFYTRTKVVTSRWPESLATDIDLRFPGTR
ncbi:MAG TPA: CoA-acylating methylmalonate-semialdehyde dehydrogenase [Acidimicrobiales bacterium]|nr:CoA-acylating methylmalonate-semialdehyde dehydrogenase [Acidimicrobiales bacterium]